MSDETTSKILWGTIFTAITALYAFLITHLRGHTRIRDIDDLKQNLDEHKKTVQYKDNCTEIVKRHDENHKELCRKLDRIMDHLQNGS